MTTKTKPPTDGFLVAFQKQIDGLGYLAGRPGNEEELRKKANRLAAILELVEKSPSFRRKFLRFYGDFMREFIIAENRKQFYEPFLEKVDALMLEFQDFGDSARRRLRGRNSRINAPQTED